MGQIWGIVLLRPESELGGRDVKMPGHEPEPSSKRGLAAVASAVHTGVRAGASFGVSGERSSSLSGQ